MRAQSMTPGLSRTVLRRGHPKTNPCGGSARDLSTLAAGQGFVIRLLMPSPGHQAM